MEIIKCTQNNLDAVAKFYDKVTAYLVKTINHSKWTPGEYPGRESTKKAIEDGAQYACLDGDTVVGAFILNDNPQGDYSEGEWKTELKDGEYLVIHTLATDPEAYHRGLGRKMVEYCIETAKMSGYKSVRLDAVPTNTPARGLYEKMGFYFAGEKDLKRGIEEIPLFALYGMDFE